MHEHAATRILFILILITYTSAAYASPYDVYGTGGADSATGLTGASSAAGPEALHYNVGALVDATPGFDVGVLAAFNNVKILMMDRPVGYDIPDLGADSPTQPSAADKPRQDTIGLPPLYGITLGGSADFGLDRLRIGALVFLPTQSALTLDTHFSDERERFASNKLHFELIDQRLRRLDLQAGGAYRITDWLSAGAGVIIAPIASMNNDVTLQDAANQEDAQINLHADTGANYGWTLGALVNISNTIKLGLSWRSPVIIEMTGENKIYVMGTTDSNGEPQIITQKLSFIPSYTPGRANFGATWTGARHEVSLDARYTRWSQFLDTHGQATDFNDTFSFGLGGKYKHAEHLELLGGVGFEPTPVPKQTGRTNYVDNSRGVVTAGARHKIAMGDRPLLLGWFVQLHVLMEQTTQKDALDSYPDCSPGETALCDEVPDDTRDTRSDSAYPDARGLQTGNPGFPGWTSGGWIGGFGVELAWEPRP